MHDLQRDTDERMRRQLLQRKNESNSKSSAPAGNDLSMSLPEDKSEKDADMVAQKVANGQPADIPPAENNSAINRKDEGGANEIPEGFASELNSSKGSGMPLDESTQAEMSSKMGADFSGVKIHTGSAANALSEKVNAKAFAHGQDVFFRDGNYNPGSQQGKELLAHELVHTQQQGNGQLLMRDIDEDLVKLRTTYAKEYTQKKKYNEIVADDLAVKEDALDAKSPQRTELIQEQKLRYDANVNIKAEEKKQKNLLKQFSNRYKRFEKKSQKPSKNKKFEGKITGEETDKKAALIESYKLQEQAINAYNNSNNKLRQIKKDILGPSYYTLILDLGLSIPGVEAEKEIPYEYYAEQVRYEKRAEEEIELAEKKETLDEAAYTTFEKGVKDKKSVLQKDLKAAKKLEAETGLNKMPVNTTEEYGAYVMRQSEINSQFRESVDMKTPARAIIKAYVEGQRPKEFGSTDVCMLLNVLLQGSPDWKDKESIIRLLKTYDPDRQLLNDIFAFSDPAKVSPELFVNTMKDSGLSSKERVEEKGKTTKAKEYRRLASYIDNVVDQLGVLVRQHTRNKELATDQSHHIFTGLHKEKENAPIYKDKFQQAGGKLLNDIHSKAGTDYDIVPVNFMDATTYFNAWDYQQQLDKAASDTEKMSIAWQYFATNYQGSLATTYFGVTNPPANQAEFESTILGNSTDNIYKIFTNVDRRFWDSENKKVKSPFSSYEKMGGDMAGVGVKTLLDEFNLNEEWEFFNNYKLKPFLDKAQKNKYVVGTEIAAGAGYLGWGLQQGIERHDFTPFNAANLYKLDKTWSIYDKTQTVGTTSYNQKLSLGLNNKRTDDVYGGMPAISEFFGNNQLQQYNYHPGDWYKGAKSSPRLTIGGNFNLSTNRTQNPLSSDKDKMNSFVDRSFSLSGNASFDWIMANQNNQNQPSPNAPIGQPGLQSQLAWQALNIGNLNWNELNPLPYIFKPQQNPWSNMKLTDFYNLDKMNTNLATSPTENVFNQRLSLNAKGTIGHVNFGLNTGFASFNTFEKGRNIQIFSVNPSIGITDLPIPIPGISGKLSAALNMSNTFANHVTNNASINILSGTAVYDGKYIKLSGTFSDDLNKNAQSTSWEIKIESVLPLFYKDSPFNAAIYFSTGQEAGSGGTPAVHRTMAGVVLRIK